MLKQNVLQLINRYESGDENLTIRDVLDELEGYLYDLEDKDVGSDLDFGLMDAIRQYVWRLHEAERFAGRCDDGSDEFLAEVKRLVGYIETDNHAYEVCPFCETEVRLDAELKVQTCPNCGKRIVTCSMCRAADSEDNYCTRCCLCYQAEAENQDMGEGV